jgi:hypothetical protein
MKTQVTFIVASNSNRYKRTVRVAEGALTLGEHLSCVWFT